MLAPEASGPCQWSPSTCPSVRQGLGYCLPMTSFLRRFWEELLIHCLLCPMNAGNGRMATPEAYAHGAETGRAPDFSSNQPVRPSCWLLKASGIPDQKHEPPAAPSGCAFTWIASVVFCRCGHVTTCRWRAKPCLCSAQVGRWHVMGSASSAGHLAQGKSVQDQMQGQGQDLGDFAPWRPAPVMSTGSVSMLPLLVPICHLLRDRG